MSDARADGGGAAAASTGGGGGAAAASTGGGAGADAAPGGAGAGAGDWASAFTTLVVDEGGIRHLPYHEARFAQDGAEALAAFRSFAGTAAPGIHALNWQAGRLSIATRGGSSLHDGMAVRLLPSPFAALEGRFPKPPPPAYAAVRRKGIATLLTDEAGVEIYEACVASVIAWNGCRWVVVPPDRPRVDSVAEAVLRDALQVVVAPVLVDSEWPLALINAVVGVCLPLCPGRGAVPTAQVEELRSILCAADFTTGC